MAEATIFRNNALPYPIYGQQWTIVFPLLDADGDPVSPSSPDSERSLNGDTFADCTNEATEIATSTGICYLTLTAAEMTADIVAVRIQSTGAKTTVVTLYPRKLVQVRTGTCADDGSGTADVVLDSGSSAVDDYYNGMVVCVVIDGAASAECRAITDYTGSTKAATVAVGFNTAVDNTDTFIVYLPEGALHGDSLYGDKIYSDTTTIQSDTTSLASDLAEGDFSDILSRLTVTNSQLLIVKSDTSDIRSALVIIASDTVHIESDCAADQIILSDVQSDTNALLVKLGEGDWSDILSRLVVTNSQLVVVKSDVAHIESDAVVIETVTSDIQSDTNVLLTKVGEGDWSDILSRLVVTNSQLVVVKSDVAVIETVTSDIQSDTNKLVSDATEVDTSDIQSLLTKVYSDTNAAATTLTKIDSDIASQFAIIEPYVSDISSDTTALEVLFNILKDSVFGLVPYGMFAIGATGNDTTHVHLADASGVDDELNDFRLVLYDVSATSYYVRTITDYVGATKLATVATLPVTPEASVDFYWVITPQAAGGSGSLSAGQDSKLTQIHSDQASQFVVLEQNTSDTESALVKIYSDTTAIEAVGASSLTSDQSSKLTRIADAIVEVDTSDIHSLLTKVYSDTTHIDSDTTHIESDAARIDSATTVIKSQLLIVKSDTSDVRSALVIIASDTLHIESDCAADQIILSDVQSDTNALLVKVTEGDWSDILSRLVVTNSQLVVVKSDVAHIESDAVVIETVTSDIQSDTNALLVKVGEGDWSDILSRLVVTNSQLVVIKSDAAHIESDAVRILSDTTAVHTQTTQINSDVISQFVVLAQNTSDTESALVKVYSDTTAIAAKTGSLTFTVAGQVDANIESVNGTTVDGAGTDGDPWGPA